MGNPRCFAALRGTALGAVAALVLLPLGGTTAPRPAITIVAPLESASSTTDAAPAHAETWTDAEWGLSIVPPDGWVRAPAESLNPISQPPDPVFEVARFQRRVGDASLYAQPIAMTDGLVADAGAVLSIGVARIGSGLVGADPERWNVTSRDLKGFVATDEDLSYEGLRTYTRYHFAKATGRVVVVRLVADEDDWSSLRATLFSALATLGADPTKQSGPEAVLPPPPPAPPAAAAPIVDPSIEIRSAIVQRAASMLNIPYVWGGNSMRGGMDCSAWVSRAWDVERYSTDSIWRVSSPIGKEELRPGDAVNLTTGRDPKRLGHIRLFEAWANAAHTAMWVYEETPPRSVHRVVAYDDRYQPIRLSGLSGAGVALIVPGTPAPERTATPRTPRPAVKATPRPTRVTPRPSAKPKPTPTPTVVPVGAALYTKTPAAKTPAPTPTATPTPR